MAIEAGSAYERIQRDGIRQATNVDLLALLLAREQRDVSRCEADAVRMAKRFAGGRVLEIGPADLATNTGLEPFEVLQRLAAMELGRRGQAHGTVRDEPLSDHSAVFLHFSHLVHEKQEHFCAVYLDSKNHPLRTHTVHIGTLTTSFAGPREVFREAIREGAASLIVAHNHPSGDPSPSPEDIAVTRRLSEVGRLLDIPLLDHIIIGNQAYYSMSKEGVL